MLSLLDRVVAEVQFSQERQVLDVSQLQHLMNTVEGKVQKAERFDRLKAFKLFNFVLR